MIRVFLEPYAGDDSLMSFQTHKIFKEYMKNIVLEAFEDNNLQVAVEALILLQDYKMLFTQIQI